VLTKGGSHARGYWNVPVLRLAGSPQPLSNPALADDTKRSHCISTWPDTASTAAAGEGKNQPQRTSVLPGHDRL